MKIAIIGAGASGLGAAALLAQDPTNQLTVYESASEAGGGVCTIDFPTPSGGTTPIDMGVAITSPWEYPNLYAFFNDLGVATTFCSVDVGASFGGESWVTGQDSRFWSEHAAEAARFELQMFAVLNSPDPTVFLSPLSAIAGDYSPDLLNKMLFPMMAAFQTQTTGLIDQPQAYAAGFLQVTPFAAPAEFRTADRGMRDFVARLSAPFAGSIRTSTPVQSVSLAPAGGPPGLVVQDALGNPPELYDHVIFATNADVADRILTQGNITAQSATLQVFKYQTADVYLHSDTSYLSPALPPSTKCQYWYDGENPGSTLNGVSTLRVGLVQGEPSALVSFFTSDTERAPPERYVAKRTSRHLCVTPEGLGARTKLGTTFQGQNNVWFCGSYTTLPFYEPCLVSGMVIAAQLRAKYPFAQSPLAKTSFDQMRNMMFATGGKVDPGQWSWIR